uniref:propane 2-monooxygenase n=1 Tax=Mycobacterium sp. M156 TaxID=263548 RepID=Q5QJ57_9MYCO|nr:PmoC [Mycobacterium sp. M156]
MASDATQLHEKTKAYDWDFTSVEQKPKFETKYKLPKKGKDPFRLLVRDYMKMEAEKDDRTYGFLDGAIRTREATKMEPRFVELMKMILPILTNAEYQAVAGCGMIISAINNQEMRQGYAAQMLDEVRHAQLEMALRNFYVKHYHDPAGFDLGQVGLYQHPAGLLSIGEFQHFNTGDPLDCIIDLNIVVETAFTNILLVAMPQVAVRNGDNALATTMLSIQSDESRHMANGYGAIMSVLGEPDNVPMINESLERHFWHAHKSLDAAIGWGSEYGAHDRAWSYKDQWDEWVVDDFIGGFVDRLSEFGLTPPSRLAAAAEEVTWTHHTVGQVLSAVWPLNFWRSDAMGPADFEWFENNYPGWSAAYQGYWEAYKELADPAGGHIMLQELPGLPPMCQVCQTPCVIPRLDTNTVRIVELDGQNYALCSEGCEWIFGKWPDAYKDRKQLWERYDGWDLADVVLDLGYVRPDGHTLIGQPLLKMDRFWTIDDIRRLGYEVKNPMLTI